MIDNDTAYLEIYQFGEDTGAEVDQYMQLFKDSGAKDIMSGIMAEAQRTAKLF